MVFEARIIKSISSFNPEKWDSLSSDVFTSFGWVKSLEELKPIPIIPYYILVFKKEELAAFAMAYIQTDELNATLTDTLLGKYRAVSPIAFNPCILCYSPLSVTGKGIEISEAFKTETKSILKLIVANLERIAAHEKVDLYGFQNVTNTDFLIQNELKAAGFTSAFTCYDTHIDVTWSNFDDYLRSLTRGSRSAKKRELKHHRKLGIETRISSDVDFDKIIPLIKNTFEKHNNRIFRLNKSFFYSLKENLGQDFLVFSDVKGEELVSVSVFFHRNKTLTGFKVGTNESLAEGTYTNFVSYIYEPIAYSIANGCTGISLGTSSYKYKIVRGAKAMPKYLYLKSTSRIKNRYLKTVLPVLGAIKLNKHQKQVTDSRKLPR